MHAWLAFVIGVFVIIGAFLFYAGLTGTTYYGLSVSVEEILAVTLFIIAVVIVLIFYKAIKAQFRRVKTGKEALIGAVGVATTDLKPKGEIRVMGEFWGAIAKEGIIATGETVEVVEMDGMILVVKPIEQKA